MLYCSNLDPPPENISQCFSAVLGDVFHAMDRAKVPVKHEYKKAYFVALMNAFLVWDKTKFNTISSILQDSGWSKDTVDGTLYFRPRFFQKRVEQIVLPPRELYWRVRAVFVTFGCKVDSKTNQPLFNQKSWTKANNLLNEILSG